jgi:hypothetical protein
MVAVNSQPLEGDEGPWPELDRGFLEAERRSAPPFPLEIFPEAWRPWVDGHARASTCVDYAAQALLAAVSAVCGSRVVIDVTPQWREPLVLWQAMVGAPSTGKTPALVAARRELANLTAPPDRLPASFDRAKQRDDEPEITAWFLHRGISHWRDDLGGLLTGWSRDRAQGSETAACWTGDLVQLGEDAVEVGAHVRRCPESIFGSLQADALVETLDAADDRLSSRFLYSWPVPRLEARLDGGSGDGSAVQRLLQRLLDLPGTIIQPTTLALSEAAAEGLQELLPRLRAFMRDSEGLEAAWIGKAAGNIVRLAGLLSLMDWAAGKAKEPCTTIDEDHVERAHALWTDYYWPHAQAVLGQGTPTLTERRARRVGRWLKRMRLDVVSREEVRREGLGQTVDADTAESVIERLERYGVLRMLKPHANRGGGRPRRRWEVNPDLWAG